MICFMFLGQPLTANPLMPEDPVFAAVADLTRRRTGLELATLARPDNSYSDQVALQIYGCAISLYQNRIHRNSGLKPGMIAEHSMGVYAALAAAGALSEGDALELTMLIGTAVGQLQPTTAYAFGCITGLTAPPLLAIAENNGVFLANRNTSRHFLLAGSRHGIEAALAEALTAGAFTVSHFPSDAPLHTPLIEPLRSRLTEIVGNYRYREPGIPVMEHLSQDFLAAADIPAFLVDELCQPVNWEATFLALRANGIRVFTEVGHGDSLKKYNRWINTEHN